MSKLLITGDWHIRYTVPICLDLSETDWLELQKSVLDNIVNIAIKNDVDDILIGGDVFHSMSSSNYQCINLVLDFAKNCYDNDIGVVIIAGNHDLPYHNSENLDKSPIGILFKSKYIKSGYDYDIVDMRNFDDDNYTDCQFMFKHILTLPENNNNFFECETPETLLSKYKADVIFTADYHKNFNIAVDDRRVINAGCITCQNKEFKNYEFGVYVFDTDTKNAEFVKLEKQDYKFSDNSKVELKAMSDFVNEVKDLQNDNIDFLSLLSLRVEKENETIKQKIKNYVDVCQQ